HQLYDWFENGNAPRGRQHRSLLLSSARALLFNRLLSWRVEQGDWDRLLAGDRMILDGSNSHFSASAEQPGQLAERLRSGDIHPSGPLWGKGLAAVTDVALALENRLPHCFPMLCRGLEQRGLTMQRRSLRLPVQSLEYRVEDDRLHIAFALPTGAYATSVLRELCHYSDEGPLAVAGNEEAEARGDR
ncbi:MAG: tRNA pseudouridine(13) synthase TruD, partial [Pseudomonadota bacterium]